MRTALIGVLVITGAACKPPEKPQPRAQTVATVVFRNVKVNAFEGVDVAVDEENIVLIGDDLSVTRSAVQIDGTGKTLVPAPVDVSAAIELVDPAKLEEGIARAELYQKRPVIAATTLAEAKAAVEAGVDGLVGVVADAPLDDAFLQAAAQRGVFVIASLPAGDAVPPEVINNVVAMRGKLPVIAGAGPEQLARLVDAGFLPEEAIEAATVIPAAVFGLEERGRIVEGYRADLLLVEGDPYQDITAMGRVAGEWRAGVSVSAGTE
jgi:predicted amidohydrolase